MKFFVFILCILFLLNACLVNDTSEADEQSNNNAESSSLHNSSYNSSSISSDTHSSSSESLSSSSSSSSSAVGDTPQSNPRDVDTEDDDLTCSDHIDNDGNGFLDCNDPSCEQVDACIPESKCDDGVDNDGDTATDCDDSNCAQNPVCTKRAECIMLPDGSGYGTFEDSRDLQMYGCTHIGEQRWMTSNLKYLPSIGDADSRVIDRTYRVPGYAGDDVAEAKETEHFKALGVQYTVYTAQTACPPGWHAPAREEWKQLAETIMDETGEGAYLYNDWESGLFRWETYSPLAQHLKSTSDTWLTWADNAGLGVGLNTYNFSARPDVKFDAHDGLQGEGALASWWTSSFAGFQDAYSAVILSSHSDSLRITPHSAGVWHAVRCVQTP